MVLNLHWALLSFYLLYIFVLFYYYGLLSSCILWLSLISEQPCILGINFMWLWCTSLSQVYGCILLEFCWLCFLEPVALAGIWENQYVVGRQFLLIKTWQYLYRLLMQTPFSSAIVSYEFIQPIHVCIWIINLHIHYRSLQKQKRNFNICLWDLVN